MIPFKTQLGSFEIPSSYEDVTIDDLLFYQNHKDNALELFARFTGLPKKTLVLLDLDPIIPYLDFLSSDLLGDIEPSESITINGVSYNIPDVGLCEWGQKLIAKNCIQENNLLGVLCVYLHPVVNDTDFDSDKYNELIEQLKPLSVIDVYSALKNIINQLEAWVKIESEQLKYTPTYEQKLAGIENFNVLGDFNTIDMIAKGDPLKYEKVLKIDYNTIFNKLLKNNISFNFEQKYNEIMSKE